LHDWELLVEGRSSDIDLVVAKNDLQQLEAALHQRYRVLTMLRYEATSFGFVLGPKVGDPIPFLIADFTTDYRWKGRVFFTDKELLQDRRQYCGFWVAGPRQELAYLLLKKVYEKGFVPEHQRIRLKQLAAVLGEAASPVVERLVGKEWGSRLIEWITDERWTELEANIKRLRRRIRWQVVKSDPLNPVYYWVPELSRIWQRCCYPTGLLVALLGPAGAGKSALIEHLEDKLVGPFRRTAVFSLRPALFGPKVTDVQGRSTHRLWFSLLKTAYDLLVYGLCYRLKVGLSLISSTLLIFDYHYGDLPLGSARHADRRGSRIARLARRCIPKPDLFLILEVAEGPFLSGKQEVSIDELRREREAYEKFAVDANVFILDSSLPANEMKRKASQIVLEYLQLCYLKRRHLWFGTLSQTPSRLESSFFSSEESHIASENPVDRLALRTGK
jgi:hypothetical protein